QKHRVEGEGFGELVAAAEGAGYLPVEVLVGASLEEPPQRNRVGKVGDLRVVALDEGHPQSVLRRAVRHKAGELRPAAGRDALDLFGQLCRVAVKVEVCIVVVVDAVVRVEPDELDPLVEVFPDGAIGVLESVLHDEDGRPGVHRSEERRVGKEWWLRGRPVDGMKNDYGNGGI